jgi:hypothetical protein
MSSKEKMPATGANQGEGDREAARRYNQDQQQFVQSGKVEDGARRAQGQDPAEAERAEKAGKERAKEFDPAETRNYQKPDKA